MEERGGSHTWVLLALENSFLISFSNLFISLVSSASFFFFSSGSNSTSTCFLFLREDRGGEVREGVVEVGRGEEEEEEEGWERGVKYLEMLEEVERFIDLC